MCQRLQSLPHGHPGAGALRCWGTLCNLCLCELRAATIGLSCRLWALPPAPFWGPEELRASWVLGARLLSDGSWTESGNLALREPPNEVGLLLARTWTLEGESCALGLGTLLSGQRRTFVW